LPDTWDHEPRRFPPRLTVEETAQCFIVRDANGQPLAFVYCENDPGRGDDGQAAHPRRVSVIQTGDLIVNVHTKRVEVNGASVCLTGKEYKMLELLALRKGMTITKETFLNYLYGGMDEPEGKIIDVFMCKLRKKLASASGGNEFIETIWGRGYVLGEPEVAPL
jgi:DNA-binding response OmpR family regulator